MPFAGDKGSFSSLVRRFGGDIPPGAMRTELKRVGSIVEDDNGDLNIVRRSILPSDQTENLVTSLVHSAYPLLSTIFANTATDREPAGLAQFAAYSTNIRKDDLKRLRRISYDRLSDTAESFDDIFIAYETLHESGNNNKETIVSVGLYYFEERDDKANYTW